MTSKDFKVDIEQLADLHHDGVTKTEELQAAGGAEDIAYSLNPVSFFQRSRLASRADLARFEAVRYIRDLARKQLASQMDSAMHFTSGDPICERKGQIPDMFLRLEYGSAAGEIAKAYCDKELSETEAERANKNAEIANVQAKYHKRRQMAEGG